VFNNLIEDVDDPFEFDEIRYTAGTELAYLTHVQRGNRILFAFTADFFNFDTNPSPRVPMPEEGDDFRVHTASAGYEHHFSSTLTTTARVGYSFTAELDRDDGNQDSGVVGSIELVKLLRTGEASIGYQRALTSGGGDGGSAISDRVVTQITTNLSSKMTAGLGANVTFLDFQGQEDDNDDRVFFTIRPKLSYQVLRALQLSTSYIFARSVFDNTSTEPDRTDHRFDVASRLIFRAGWSVALSYEYRTRSFENVVGNNREDDEFTRNRVFLSVTYGPTFRF
jgi:hypothetical protein